MEINETQEKLMYALISSGVPSEQAEMCAIKAPDSVLKAITGLSKQEAADYIKKEIKRVSTDVEAVNELRQAFIDCDDAIVENNELANAINKVLRKLKDEENMPIAVATLAIAAKLFTNAHNRVKDEDDLALLLSVMFEATSMPYAPIVSALMLIRDRKKEGKHEQ